MPTSASKLSAFVALPFLTKVILVSGIASVHRQPPLWRGDKNILTGSSSASCVALRNTGAYSLVDIAVGTPEQIFSIVADTGSDNVIIPSCACQDNHRCFSKDRCFTGTNKSSTFKIDEGPHGPDLFVIEFGSGPIQIAVSSDVVRVGNVQTVMDNGVYLMMDQDLNFGGSFEGILGLGLPSTMRASAREWEEEEEGDSSKLDGLDVIIQDVIDSISDADPSLSESGHIAKKIKRHASSPRHAPVSDREDSSGLISIVHAPSSNASMDRQTQSEDPYVLDQPGFLEAAGVNRFSMCFTDAEEGALRLNPPPAARTLTNVGHHHWSVEFRGVSVGGNSTGLEFCESDSPLRGDETPCAAIPDSGTTAILGPRLHVEMLFDTICDGWERCRQNHTAMVAAATAASAAAAAEYGFDPFGTMIPASKSEIFKFLLFDCSSWLDESDDGLNELPSISFTIGGTNGTEQVLEMPAWSYVIEERVDDFQSFQNRGREILPMFSDIGVRNASTEDSPTDSNASSEDPGSFRICEPAFESMDFVTASHGPVWIFGSPFFYMFDIGYDAQTSPPGVSFTSIADAGCGTCATDSNPALVAESRSISTMRRQHRQPRRGGPKRKPSIDTSRPL